MKELVYTRGAALPQLLKERILVLDGAMGTMIQRYKLGEAAPEPRGGFEIVDKFAQKDIFIEGAMADTFQAGAAALMAGTPSEEDIDDYIGRFTALMAQPLVVH